MDNHFGTSSGEDDYEVIPDYAFDSDEPGIIAVMGATGSGKSTFINLVSGSNLPVGDGLKSCTSNVEFSRPFELGGRTVTLIDTPGFDDTARSDTDILKLIAVELSRIYQDGYKLSGILYLHRISDFRMTGMSRRNFALFRKLCGDDSLRNVIIVTTMWSEVSAARGLAREDELATDDMFFRPVLDKGAKMLRHDNSPASAAHLVGQLVPNRRRTLLIQRELVDEEKDIAQTAAGEELAHDLAEQTRRFREELQQIHLEKEEALLAQDIEAARELEQEHTAIETKVHMNDEKQKSLAGTLVGLALAVGVAVVTGRTMLSRQRTPPS